MLQRVQYDVEFDVLREMVCQYLIGRSVHDGRKIGALTVPVKYVGDVGEKDLVGRALFEFALKVIRHHSVLSRRLNESFVWVRLADWAHDVIFPHDTSDALQVHRHTEMTRQNHLDLPSSLLSLLEVKRLQNEVAKNPVFRFALLSDLYPLFREIGVVSLT